MVPNQNDRVFVMLHPVSATNGATITATTLDTQGWEDIAVSVINNTVGTSFTTDSITVSESDDNTTFTNIAALCGGTATSATVGVLLTADKSAVDNKPVYEFTVRKRGARKRYLKVAVVPATTGFFTVVARASGKSANASADSTAERNVRVFANA